MPKSRGEKGNPKINRTSENGPKRSRPWEPWNPPDWGRRPSPPPRRPQISVHPQRYRDEDYRSLPAEPVRCTCRSGCRPSEPYYENSAVCDAVLPRDVVSDVKGRDYHHIPGRERFIQKDEKEICDSRRSGIAEDEKRIAFASFLKTFTTFMVQAKSNDNDLRLVRELLGSVLGDKGADRPNEALIQRLTHVEKSLASSTNLSEKLRKLETKVTSIAALSERVNLLDDRIKSMKGSGSDIRSDIVLQRIERLESLMTNDVSLLKRLELVENRLMGENPALQQLCSSRGEISIEGDSSSNSGGIVRRIAQLEAHVGAEAPVLKQRLDEVESRLAGLEPRSGIVTQETRAVIGPIEVMDLCEEPSEERPEPQASPVANRKGRIERETGVIEVNEPIQIMDLCEELNVERQEPQTSSATKRKGPSEFGTGEELKPIVLEPEAMQFIMDGDDYVSAHIHAVGTKGGTQPAGVRVWFGDQHPLNVSRPLPGKLSKNFAELTAALLAIDLSIEAGLEKLALHSNSKYLTRVFAKLSLWHSQCWTRKSGVPLKNVEELKKLRRSLLDISVTVKYADAENKARSLADVAMSVKQEQD